MKMNFRLNSGSFIFLISWYLYFLQLSAAKEKICYMDNVFNNHCGDNGLCYQTMGNTGVCQCKESFHLDNGICVKTVDPSADSKDYNKHHDTVSRGRSITFWILVPCMIVLITGALLFMIKRLKLVEKLYQFRVRRYNTVFVTSMQDDDAPIT